MLIHHCLNLLPPWFKGLSFAALTAAVVASLAGKANSIATIFTLDIYKKKIKTEATDNQLVVVGKIAVVVAMVLGIIISPFMGIDKKGGSSSYRNIPALFRRVYLPCSSWVSSGKRQLQMRLYSQRSAALFCQ